MPRPPTQLQRASDPTTPGAELAAILASSCKDAVKHAAASNPNLPRAALIAGVWDHHHRVGYLLNPSLLLALLEQPELGESVRGLALGVVPRPILRTCHSCSAKALREVARLLERFVTRLSEQDAAACRAIEEELERDGTVEFSSKHAHTVAELLREGVHRKNHNSFMLAVDMSLMGHEPLEAMSELALLCRQLVAVLPRQKPTTLEALTALERLAGPKTKPPEP